MLGSEQAPQSETGEDESRPSKRARNFIARQACEACRQKKTRCDEDVPCSLCKSLGIECSYTERKPTKNEVSMSMVFNTLKRMEAKIDHLSEAPVSKAPPSLSSPAVLEGHPEQVQSPDHLDTVTSSKSDPSPASNVRAHHQPVFATPPLSFSAHRTIHWPGVARYLPKDIQSTVRLLDHSYPTRLESERAPLDPNIPAQLSFATGDWLSSLSISCVKDLSNAYFDTFNRIYPFIDRDFYFLSTVAVVVREGFGYDIESCLVLNVMALGCLGLKAYEEGGFELPGQSAVNPLIRQVMEEPIAGLSFFNEGRKRIGFSLERDIQSCQYYLASALFYAENARPVDEWMMTNRAITNCAAFWKCPPEPMDEWHADMQARIFWSAVALESVIVQELELPPSNTKDLEETVPLPKFTIFPYAANSKSLPQNPEDSYYHYHFLAQIAHRIILSRIRHELFYPKPSPALADELRHQLEQWRRNLPSALQYSDDATGETTFSSPAEAVAVSLLYARYRICIFHLGRPFLHKAIQDPGSLTERDLQICAEALRYAMDWPLTWDACCRMKSFMPLKFFAPGQMFGQLFIFHCFRSATDERLRAVLPDGHERWCAKMLDFVGELSEAGPTLAADYELLARLYRAGSARSPGSAAQTSPTALEQLASKAEQSRT